MQVKQTQLNQHAKDADHNACSYNCFCLLKYCKREYAVLAYILFEISVAVFATVGTTAAAAATAIAAVAAAATALIANITTATADTACVADSLKHKQLLWNLWEVEISWNAYDSWACHVGSNNMNAKDAKYEHRVIDQFRLLRFDIEIWNPIKIWRYEVRLVVEDSLLGLGSAVDNFLTEVPKCLQDFFFHHADITSNRLLHLEFGVKQQQIDVENVYISWELRVQFIRNLISQQVMCDNFVDGLEYDSIANYWGNSI